MRLRLYLRGLGIGIIVTALLMGFTLANKGRELSDEEIIARASELGMVEEGKTLFQNSAGESDITDTPEDASVIMVENPTGDETGNDPLSDTGPEEADSDLSVKEEKDELTVGEEKDEPAADASNPSDTKPAGDNPAAGEDEKEKDPSGNMVAELSVSGTSGGESSIEIHEKDADAAETEKESTQDTGTKPEEKSDKGSSTSGGGKQTDITVRNGDDSYDVAEQLKKTGAIDDAGKFDEYLVGRKLDRYISSGSFHIPAGSSYAEITKILTGR